MSDGHIFDDLFHGAALAAFVEQACREQGWPCPDATRWLAYRYYEEGLAARNTERVRQMAEKETA
jgi:hypothetical protein